jgi:hypothetical protein
MRPAVLGFDASAAVPSPKFTLSVVEVLRIYDSASSSNHYDYRKDIPKAIAP